MHPLPAARAAALIAIHQLLMAAQALPADSPERLDCAGAATDIALTLEAYCHLFGAPIADPG